MVLCFSFLTRSMAELRFVIECCVFSLFFFQCIFQLRIRGKIHRADKGVPLKKYCVFARCTECVSPKRGNCSSTMAITRCLLRVYSETSASFLNSKRERESSSAATAKHHSFSRGICRMIQNDNDISCFANSIALLARRHSSALSLSLFRRANKKRR